MSPPGGRADVIGVKADIASLAGRPGLRRRRNRLASGYIWPYSAISALRLPRALPTPGSRSWGAYTGPRSRNTGMRTGTATITPRIADEPMGHFEIANCIVPRRLTASIDKFLGKRRTGNIRLNIKDGKILGAHVEEIFTFKGSRPNPGRDQGVQPNRVARRGVW